MSMNFHQLSYYSLFFYYFLLLFFLLLFATSFSEHKTVWMKWPNLMLQSTLVGWRAHVILKEQCSDFVGSSQHFGSEWFWEFWKEFFLYIYSAGENIQFFTEIFLLEFVIILVSMHTYFYIKHWEKSQSIEDNMATASIGP